MQQLWLRNILKPDVERLEVIKIPDETLDPVCHPEQSPSQEILVSWG